MGLLFLLFPTDSRQKQLCRDLVLNPLHPCPNPVGYQNKDVASGLASQIPTFETVGGEGSKLSNFIVVDKNGEKVSNAVTVQFYGSKGKLEEAYHFCKEGDAGWGDLPEGWFDDEEEEVKDKDIDFGKGFFSNTASGDNKLVYSGQVDIGGVAIPVSGGLSMMGNFRPTEVKMSDIKVVDVNDEEVSNAVTLQFYGSTGKLLESYHYCKEGDAGWGDLPAGWFDDEEEEVKDKNLGAGVGFMAQGNGAEVFLKFPAIGNK